MNFWGLFKIFLTEMGFFSKIDNFSKKYLIFLLAIFEKKWKKRLLFFSCIFGGYKWGKTLEPMLYCFTKKI